MTESLVSPAPVTLNTMEAAEYMRISPRTLEKLRTLRGGPAYHKVGRRVVYVLADLQVFLAQHRHDPAAASAAAGPVAP